MYDKLWNDINDEAIDSGINIELSSENDWYWYYWYDNDYY